MTDKKKLIHIKNIDAVDLIKEFEEHDDGYVESSIADTPQMVVDVNE